MSNRGFVIFLCVVGGLWLASRASDSGNSSQPSSTSVSLASTTAKGPDPSRLDELRSATQKAFMSVVEDGRLSFKAGANDMAKGAARPARARALCRVMNTNEVRAWIGQVAKLSSNGDGKGVLGAKIDRDLHFKTWNNSVSDIGDRTLIDLESPLSTRASSLKEGQWIVFSGYLIKNQTDCYRESSMTIEGSMLEPEFIMRFVDVTPLQL